MKCKNIECENETKNKNVYCSLKCRNIYVNKYLRDYSKVKETFKNNRIENQIEYLKNPNICKFCNSIIPFEKRLDNYDFCNHSCSAKFNNRYRKGIKYNLSEDGRKNLIDSALKNFYGKRGSIDSYKIEKELYFENPKKCLNCESMLDYKKRKGIYCNINCKKEYFIKTTEDYKLYHLLTKFKFNLRDYDFDFSLVKEYGWYKAKNNGNNIGGVSRDHKFSVKEGFRRLVNPLLIAHPANCELIFNKHNQSKCDKCSISIENLLENIKNFEIKYGKYYEDKIKTYIDLNELKELYKQ